MTAPSAAIARYGITDTDVVTRLAETLAILTTSYPPAAGVDVAALREQVLRESGGPKLQAFDRKILSDLYDRSGEGSVRETLP